MSPIADPSKSLPKRFSVMDEYKQVAFSVRPLRNERLMTCSISMFQRISDRDGDEVGQIMIWRTKVYRTARPTRSLLPRAL